MRLISNLVAGSQRLSVATEDLGDGIIALRLQSRWTKVIDMEVTAYIVGDLLVDTGFSHARELVLGMLDGRKISTVCCTHNHEDHTGNCPAVARKFGCNVYLYRADARWSEGVGKLLPYRRLFWGAPGPYEAEEMLPLIAGDRKQLRVVTTPGHSATHVCFFEPESQTVFVGDLFVAPGASAVLTQEDPYAHIASLLKVAALQPRRMLTGHGLDIEDPVEKLLSKANAIDKAARKACRLVDEGRRVRAVVRKVFPTGNLKDRILEALTQGEFSRANFVRAAVRRAECDEQT